MAGVVAGRVQSDGIVFLDNDGQTLEALNQRVIEKSSRSLDIHCVSFENNAIIGIANVVLNPLGAAIAGLLNIKPANLHTLSDAMQLKFNLNDVYRAPFLYVFMPQSEEKHRDHWVTTEHEKKGHAENYEHDQVTEKNSLTMAWELEKFRAEEANAEKGIGRVRSTPNPNPCIFLSLYIRQSVAPFSTHY
ncbi:FLX-like protein 1 [Tanacetum coccineum]|uniref:FLX-like protein 1 n=1 Tax=Tanacetum coccineum TaxID=301880 RepID=A0ABQ4X6W6_9ASTR